MLWLDLSRYGLTVAPDHRGMGVLRLRAINDGSRLGDVADVGALSDALGVPVTPNPDDASEILVRQWPSLAGWRRAFPDLSRRWTDLSPDDLDRPYHWLYRVVEPNPAVTPERPLHLSAVHLYAVTPELARAHGNAATPVSVKAVRHLGAGDTEGTFWGVEEGDIDAPDMDTLRDDLLGLAEGVQAWLADADRAALVASADEDADADEGTEEPEAWQSHEDKDQSDSEPGRREDYGEVIPLARKHIHDSLASRLLAASGDDEVSMVSRYGTPGISPTEAKRIHEKARNLARRFKRDQLWPEIDPIKAIDDAKDGGQPFDPIMALLASRARAAIHPSTVALLNPKRKRGYVAPADWIRVGSGYAALVLSLRDRFNGVDAHQNPERFMSEGFAYDRDLADLSYVEWSQGGVPEGWFQDGDNPDFALSPDAKNPGEEYAGRLYEMASDLPVSLIHDRISGKSTPASGFTAIAYDALFHAATRGEGEPARLAREKVASLSALDHPDARNLSGTYYLWPVCSSRLLGSEARAPLARAVQSAFTEWAAEVRALDLSPRDTAAALFGVTEAMKTDTAKETAASTPVPPVTVPAVPSLKNPVPPRYKNLTREGPDRRELNGDVSEDDLLTRFGFRGVQYGNWVNQKERQFMLNATYDSMADMAAALGVPDRFMGLYGRLGLALGARGRGGNAAAHYERGLKVLNLTKTMGAGATAHEWVHALDHWLGEREGQPMQYLSGMVAGSPGRLAHEDEPAGQDMRSLMRYFLARSVTYGSQREAEEARQGLQSQRFANHMAEFKRVIFSPKRLSMGGMDSEEGRVVAATWADRMKPWVDHLEKHGARALFEPRGSRLVFSREYLTESIQEVMAQSGAALNDAELAFLAEWVKWGIDYKDASKLWRSSNKIHYGASSTMFMGSARLLDGDKDGKYWSTPHELTARALSTVIHERMAAMGVRNDFATRYSAPAQFTLERGYRASCNPEGPEVERVVKAAEPLITAIQDLAQRLEVTEVTEVTEITDEPETQPERAGSRLEGDQDIAACP